MKKIAVPVKGNTEVLVSVWFVKEGKGLAVQKLWNADSYAIVHMQSRKLVLSCKLYNREIAKKAMMALLETGINWTLSGEELEKLVIKGSDAYEEYHKVRNYFTR